MQRALLHVERRFSDCFAQGGMRMGGAADILGAAAEFNHGNSFSNQFRSGVVQDVCAKNAIGFCVSDELYHSFHIIAAKRAAVRAEWKFTNSDIGPLLFGLIFAETNTG